MEHSPFRYASEGRIHTAVGLYEKVHADLTTYLISFSMVQETCKGTETYELELKRSLFKFVASDGTKWLLMCLLCWFNVSIKRKLKKKKRGLNSPKRECLDMF